MFVRKAENKDIPQIAYVQLESWKTAYKGILSDNYLASLCPKDKEKNWRANGLDYPNALGSTWVLEWDNEIRGFICAGPQRDPFINGVGEIYAIYILGEYRNLGGGCLLLKEAMTNLIKKGYSCASVLVIKNNPSQQFYKALGAIAVEEKPFKIANEDLIEVRYFWETLKTFAIH